ncbi:hypothetical protein TVAG_410130 [Trichomonas vaginalis G3]|uniref:Uncharacterized protein n=1 Tax=Trichomonas vaginalis (strain ATCC PRA-98 / G3) TaxID=412133 RepID=A2E8H9_TRIV3|nr:hypothetical protein TVAGG3_0358940 [Trichomonas vaginalis G3]EAY11016.1 hypothetical protein TVAG_410130 [Trichomonas vaginalis G3]KAI5531810.1 hypothetical protein TVAGG3_0358940 [Trichomonas vaginalis G3]|eukprot:XP_001323239.1 hypothetical protein [Trichomonas vaginalis G3]
MSELSDLEKFNAFFNDDIGRCLISFIKSQNCPKIYLNTFNQIEEDARNNKYKDTSKLADDIILFCKNIAHNIGDSPISYGFLQFSKGIKEKSQNQNKIRTLKDILNDLDREFNEYWNLLPDSLQELYNLPSQEGNTLPTYDPVVERVQGEVYNQECRDFIYKGILELKTDDQIQGLVEVLKKNCEVESLASMDYTINFKDMNPIAVSQLKKYLTEANMPKNS